jgi:hypothetical protein
MDEVYEEPTIETTETINDDIIEILEEVLTEEVIEQPIEHVINVEEIINQETDEKSDVRRLSYVKKS